MFSTTTPPRRQSANALRFREIYEENLRVQESARRPMPNLEAITFNNVRVPSPLTTIVLGTMSPLLRQYYPANIVAQALATNDINQIIKYATLGAICSSLPTDERTQIHRQLGNATANQLDTLIKYASALV